MKRKISLVSLLLLLFVTLAFYVSGQVPSQPSGSESTESRIQKLETKISDLEKRVTELEHPKATIVPVTR